MKTYASIILIFLVLSLTSCAAQPAAAPAITSDAIVEKISPTSSSPSLTATGAKQSIQTDDILLFDDFDYSAQTEMTENGWIIRAKPGWPGVPGATFRQENVSFENDPLVKSNRLVRMTSSSDGTSTNTFQTQICHQRKYFEGTYAARVYFNNSPATGPDGDQVVQSFYMITPYEEPLLPEYSEMDFEYLANGGWGWEPMSFMFTTWETVRIEPWLADNKNNSKTEDMEGWHTLVAQVMNNKVKYYVSGFQEAVHEGNYYPDAPMSINFNLWFVNGGLIGSREVRSYQEDIDWVFYSEGLVLSPEEVNIKIQSLRDLGIHFQDTVPPGTPALPSPCDL